MFKTTFGLSILLCVVFLMIPGLSHAQLDPGCNPDLPCPIDGGLSFLIAAGIGIGAKKAYDHQKKESAAKQ